LLIGKNLWFFLAIRIVSPYWSSIPALFPRPRIFITRTVLSAPGSYVTEDSGRSFHVPRTRYSTNTKSLRNFSMY